MLHIQITPVIWTNYITVINFLISAWPLAAYNCICRPTMPQRPAVYSTAYQLRSCILRLTQPGHPSGYRCNESGSSHVFKRRRFRFPCLLTSENVGWFASDYRVICSEPITTSENAGPVPTYCAGVLLAVDCTVQLRHKLNWKLAFGTPVTLASGTFEPFWGFLSVRNRQTDGRTRPVMRPMETAAW